MRLWLLIALMVLLPLRAWAGDAMAIAMAGAPSSAQGAAHCDDHAMAGADAASPADAPTDSAVQSPTQTHALCDVCNGPVMLGTDHRPLPLFLAPLTRVAPEGDSFVSALPRRDQKPPIS